MSTLEDIDLVRACAGGERRAQRVLMKRLIPVIRMQISLLLRHMTPGRDIRQELCDLQQDVLVELLRARAQELRRWDPDVGLSLEGFVRLVTRRYVARPVAARGARDRAKRMDRAARAATTDR